MTTTRRNFSNQVPPEVIDTEYVECNFTQKVPVTQGQNRRGVVIFGADTTPRTFIDCNLCNVEVPPGSTVSGGNTTIKEFEVVDEDNSQEVELPDETLWTFDVPQDVVYGRVNPTTLEYEDKPTPETLKGKRKKR